MAPSVSDVVLRLAALEQHFAGSSMCFAAVDADEVFESASANGGPLSRAALEALQEMLSTGGGAACAAAAAVAAAVKTSPRRLQQILGRPGVLTRLVQLSDDPVEQARRWARRALAAAAGCAATDAPALQLIAREPGAFEALCAFVVEDGPHDTSWAGGPDACAAAAAVWIVTTWVPWPCRAQVMQQRGGVLSGLSKVLLRCAGELCGPQSGRDGASAAAAAAPGAPAATVRLASVALRAVASFCGERGGGSPGMVSAAGPLIAACHELLSALAALLSAGAPWVEQGAGGGDADELPGMLVMALTVLSTAASAGRERQVLADAPGAAAAAQQILDACGGGEDVQGAANACAASGGFEPDGRPCLGGAAAMVLCVLRAAHKGSFSELVRDDLEAASQQASARERRQRRVVRAVRAAGGAPAAGRAEDSGSPAAAAAAPGGGAVGPPVRAGAGVVHGGQQLPAAEVVGATAQTPAGASQADPDGSTGLQQHHRQAQQQQQQQQKQVQQHKQQEQQQPQQQQPQEQQEQQEQPQERQQEQQQLPQAKKACAMCGKSQGRLKRCARCLGERYCSAECQAAAWPAHKAACRAAVQQGFAAETG